MICNCGEDVGAENSLKEGTDKLARQEIQKDPNSTLNQSANKVAELVGWKI